MERTLIDEAFAHNAVLSHPANSLGDRFTPELIAARLRAFEELQALLQQGTSTSGRNGRPWREWIHEDDDL